jgi:hypothetical protein
MRWCGCIRGGEQVEESTAEYTGFLVQFYTDTFYNTSEYSCVSAVDDEGHNTVEIQVQQYRAQLEKALTIVQHRHLPRPQQGSRQHIALCQDRRILLC